MSTDALYLEGIRLFNKQEYFAAHETWEELWKASAGNDRAFYQGLIQCAVSLEHFKRGNAAGARSLFRRCQKRLAPLPRTYRGLEIWSLVAQIARVLSPTIDPPRHGQQASRPAWPTITLNRDAT